MSAQFPVILSKQGGDDAHPDGGRGTQFGPHHSFEDAYSFIGLNGFTFKSTTGESIKARRSSTKSGLRAITFDGELVSLKLGSQGGAEMHYTTAIKISQMLRRAAMHAKLLAGDMTKTITVAGLLTDATSWEDELQNRRVVTATMVPKGSTIGR